MFTKVSKPIKEDFREQAEPQAVGDKHLPTWALTSKLQPQGLHLQLPKAQFSLSGRWPWNKKGDTGSPARLPVTLS